MRNSAPLTNEEDALFEHVTTALRARPADGAASGRFDLVLADAARLLSALAEAPARRARAALLAPDAAHWLVHDPTPALGFDTVYVLSDGAPRYGPVTDMDEIRRQAGEIGYRVFMSFYGLVFPAYVWICIIPRRRPPERAAPAPAL